MRSVAAGLIGASVQGFHTSDPLTARALEDLVFDIKAITNPPVTDAPARDDGVS